MKKLLAFVLALSLILSLSACVTIKTKEPDGNKASSTVATQSTEASSSETPSSGQNSSPSQSETQSPSSSGSTDTNEPEDNSSSSPTQSEPEQSSPEPDTPAPPVHTHSYTGKVTKSASCTADGVKTFTCSCSDSYTEPIPKTGHKWGDWKTVKSPTTSAEGKMERNCSGCKTIQSKAIPKLEPSEVTVTESQLKRIKEEFLRLTNLERNRLGASSLTIDSHLDSGAKLRSQEIIESFSHTRPNGESFSTVVDGNVYGWSSLGENICMTSHLGSGNTSVAVKWVGSDEQIEAAAAAIFTCFKNSPPHYESMKDPNWEDCGIGVSYAVKEGDSFPYFYVAHIFGRRF